MEEQYGSNFISDTFDGLRELRVTRDRPYQALTCPGRANLSARQGHYERVCESLPIEDAAFLAASRVMKDFGDSQVVVEISQTEAFRCYCTGRRERITLKEAK